MRRAALVIAGGLMIASPAAAQEVNLLTCDQGMIQDQRRCNDKNIAAVQRAIAKKVLDVCRTQTGSRIPAAVDACRLDRLSKLLESIK